MNAFEVKCDENTLGIRFFFDLTVDDIADRELLDAAHAECYRIAELHAFPCTFLGRTRGDGAVLLALPSDADGWRHIALRPTDDGSDERHDYEREERVIEHHYRPLREED